MIDLIALMDDHSNVEKIKALQAALDTMLNDKANLVEAEKKLAHSASRATTLITELYGGGKVAESILSTLDDQPLSNLDRLEKILIDARRPLHVSTIAKEAVRRGIPFGGDPIKPIKAKIRSSMNGSKRFQNMGSNTWWIAGMPVPGDTPAPESTQETTTADT